MTVFKDKKIFSIVLGIVFIVMLCVTVSAEEYPSETYSSEPATTQAVTQTEYQTQTTAATYATTAATYATTAPTTVQTVATTAPTASSYYTYTQPQQERPTVQATTVATDANNFYKSSGRVSDDELSDSDWKDIVLDLNNLDGDSDAGDDFNFIKKNESDVDDDLIFIIVAAILFGLSAIGIIYFVVATKRTRKLAQIGITPKSYKAKKKANEDRKQQIRNKREYSSRDDYGDDYGTPRHTAKDNGTKARRNVSAKANTAEIDLPRRSRNSSKHRYASSRDKNNRRKF
ncbi:MAG: hypothetical protein ACI4QE_01480 [Acutalibacteraceae bacterium]